MSPKRALEASARERLGGDAEGTVVAWEADLKFGTQAYELTLALGALDSSSDSVRRSLIDRFRNAYEARYGKGTHWQGAEGLITLVNLRVTVARPVASVEQQHKQQHRQPSAKSASELKTKRDCLLAHPRGHPGSIRRWFGRKADPRASDRRGRRYNNLRSTGVAGDARLVE